jgi:hypothetical protein
VASARMTPGIASAAWTRTGVSAVRHDVAEHIRHSPAPTTRAAIQVLQLPAQRRQCGRIGVSLPRVVIGGVCHVARQALPKHTRCTSTARPLGRLAASSGSITARSASGSS